MSASLSRKVSSLNVTPRFSIDRTAKPEGSIVESMARTLISIDERRRARQAAEVESPRNLSRIAR